MQYISVSQAAEKWNISHRRVQILCAQGRIPGACRIGRDWAIPADAEKPGDARIRTGRYCKNPINAPEENPREEKRGNE